MGPSTHRASPSTGTLCGAQPHPDKVGTTQALPGSLPFSQAKPGLSGVCVSPQGRTQMEASPGTQRGCEVQPGWDSEQEVSQCAGLCRDVTAAVRQTRAARHGRARLLLPSPRHGDASSGPCYKAALKNQQTGHNQGFVPQARLRDGPWQGQAGAGSREGCVAHVAEGSRAHQGWS